MAYAPLKHPGSGKFLQPTKSPNASPPGGPKVAAGKNKSHLDCTAVMSPADRDPCKRLALFIQNYDSAIRKLSTGVAPYSGAISKVHRPLQSQLSRSATLQEDFPRREQSLQKEGILVARLTNPTIDIPITKTSNIQPTMRDLRLRLIYDPGGLNGSWTHANNTLLFNTAPLAPVHITVYHETVHMFADLVSDSVSADTDNATSEALTRNGAFSVLSQYANIQPSFVSNLSMPQLDQAAWGASTARESFIDSVTSLYAAESVRLGRNAPPDRTFAIDSWDVLRGELVGRIETALMMVASEKPTAVKKALKEEVGDIGSWVREYWSQIRGSGAFVNSVAGRDYIRTELPKILSTVAGEYLRLRNRNFR